jgi:two-component system phosphate regulon sensor histidine kinase PhoR
MLFNRLVWKFIVLWGALYAVGASLGVALVLRWQRDEIANHVRMLLHEMAATVAAEGFGGSIPQQEPSESLARLARPLRGRITWLSTAGKPLADSEDAPTRIPDQGSQPEMLSAQRRGWGWDVRPHAPSGEEWVSYALRVGAGDDARFIRVMLPWDPYRRQLDGLRTRLIGLVVAGGAIGVALIMTLAVPIGRRAAELTRGTLALAEGDFSVPIDTRGEDELGTLAKSFQFMRAELAVQMDRLRRNSDRLTVVLGTMSEGVVAIDNRGVVLFANHAARALLEFATPDPVGRPFLEAVRNRPVHEVIQEALTQSEPRKVELELGSATRRMVAIHVRRLPGSPSPGALLVLHDVTDLRRLENLRQEFVANVSHELKTPLTVIKAYAETLLEGAINDPAHNLSFLRQIAEQAERLHQLILDLLSVARIESGHERFEFEPVGVKKLVDACLARYAPAAEAKSVHLTQQAIEDGLEIFADEEGMREILDNLVDNAIKYTPQGGRVNVGWGADNGMVRIDISDTGIGIPHDQQSRIFERFYRVDKARSRELGGTGLGLSIVKHLVSAFGGSVSVQSEVNQGTTFTVRLPRA